MDIVITIVKISVFFVSIIVLSFSFIRLYRWRKSAFDSTNAYLRNLRYIQPGEKVCIQAPDNPRIQYIRSEKSSKQWFIGNTAILWREFSTASLTFMKMMRLNCHPKSEYTITGKIRKRCIGMARHETA